MHSWQLALMQCAAERRALTPFLTMQHQYSLMQRAAETELLSLLESSGIPSLPWSPLARGRLARPWGSKTKRSGSDPTADRTFDERHRRVAEAVGAVAMRRDTSMAAIALAWLLQRPGVAAPIVGTTSADQLRSAADALAIDLTPTDVEELEVAYPQREAPMFL